MNIRLISLLFILVSHHSLHAETLYGLELAPSTMRDRHLGHFMELFHNFCLGRKSQQAALENLLANNTFTPAEGYDGVYEKPVEGLSYAVTPDPDACTVDVLLEYEPGRLLFPLHAVQEAITRIADYQQRTPDLEKIEQGPDSEKVQIIESRYRKDDRHTKEIVLTYPVSNQDVFFMTLDYHYQ